MKRRLSLLYAQIVNAGTLAAILLAATAIPLLLLAWGIVTGSAAAVIVSLPLMVIFTGFVVLVILGGVC
jgi:hypothetical protein